MNRRVRTGKRGRTGEWADSIHMARERAEAVSTPCALQPLRASSLPTRDRASLRSTDSPRAHESAPAAYSPPRPTVGPTPASSVCHTGEGARLRCARESSATCRGEWRLATREGCAYLSAREPELSASAVVSSSRCSSCCSTCRESSVMTIARCTAFGCAPQQHSRRPHLAALPLSHTPAKTRSHLATLPLSRAPT